MLVDIDIIIDAARNVPNAIKRLNLEEENYNLIISSITDMELIVGCRNKHELTELDDFLDRYDLVEVLEVISQKAVELLKTSRLSHGLLTPDGNPIRPVLPVNFITNSQLAEGIKNGTSLPRKQ